MFSIIYLQFRSVHVKTLRFFFFQEIILWRKADKERKPILNLPNPHIPSYLIESDDEVIVNHMSQQQQTQHQLSLPPPKRNKSPLSSVSHKQQQQLQQHQQQFPKQQIISGETDNKPVGDEFIGTDPMMSYFTQENSNEGIQKLSAL